MRRSPSFPWIHWRCIYTWNCSCGTPAEHWREMLDLPEGKKLPMYLGRAKEKRNNKDRRIGTGPAPVGGNCEGGNVSTHWESPSRAETAGGRGGKLWSHGEEPSHRGAESGAERFLYGGSVPSSTRQPERLVCSPTGADGGWELGLGLRSDRRERTVVGDVNTAGRG